MRYGSWLAFAAIAVGTAQPSLAADDRLGFAAGERHSGAFVGAYLKVPFVGGRASHEAPRAGLKFSMTHQYRDARTRRYEANFVDIGIGGDGRPTFNLAGRSLVDERGRLSFGKDGDGKGGISTWLLIGGGVLAVAGIGFAIWADSLTCTREESLADKCENA